MKCCAFCIHIFKKINFQKVEHCLEISKSQIKLESVLLLSVAMYTEHIHRLNLNTVFCEPLIFISRKPKMDVYMYSQNPFWTISILYQ